MSNEKGIYPPPKVHGFKSVSKFYLKRLNDEFILYVQENKMINRTYILTQVN
jgi:hypothetical protein